ncbi:Ig-like domain-containing protein [bacterium]|nr:Ig-like domain-containing protein [bacterium]
MKHVLKSVLIILVILTGCTEEDPLNVINDQTYNSVEIISEELEIKAFEGTESQLSFLAVVKNINGASAAGAAINFSLIGEGCSVSPTATTTDANGIVEGVITVTVPRGESTVQLLASVEGGTDVKTVSITGLEIPTKIQMSTNTPAVTVINDENVEISILASATNDQGVGLPDVNLIFALYSSHPGGEIFGSISQSSYTSTAGRTTAYFNSLGGTGSVIVRCTVDGIENDTMLFDDLSLNITTLRDEISDVNITVNPDCMTLADDSTGTAQIYARVLDENNNGVANLRVNFSCDYGSIGNVTLTDETGRAQAEYRILPMTDFPEMYQELTDHITAEIPNTDFSETCDITIVAKYSLPGALSLTTDIDWIYADNGRTTANLQLVLTDANNEAMADREINLTTTHGAVSSPVTTNELGIAHAVFSDVGLPSEDESGHSVPAVITAEYRPWATTASVEVTIKERIRIAAIALQSQEDQLTAGSGDSTWVGAICFMESGAFAPEGTIVYFECDRGRFAQPSTTVVGYNGTVVNHFIADPVVGKAHIYAYVDNGDTLVYSNMVEIELIAGPPTRVSVRPDPYDLYTTEPTVFSTITATLRDTANNHVSEGYLVTFAATLGTLDRVSASTDQNGQASVQLRPGVTSGRSVITATVNTRQGDIYGTTTVDIRAGEGNSIELSANPVNIAVAGTGVNSSSTITASLFDPNHNLVQTAHWIIFRILNESPYDEGGSHFRNRAQIDSAQTSNGRASVILNAGTISGPKLLRAYAVFGEDREDTVSTILSRVSVTSGPPEFINVGFDNEGVDIGGGAWQVEVSARVFDMYMNPVADNIPVVFTTDSVATVGEGVTGNLNRHGQSIKGMAFASLEYQSENTFDTTYIEAEVNSPSGIKRGERRITLPLQRGILTLDVSPGNWMIDYEPDAVFTCQAELRDGHGTAINNAPVIFTATRGQFYWYDHRPGHGGGDYIAYDYLADPPEPAIKYTGWNLPEHVEHREEPGQATVYLMGEMYDFFLDPVTPEVNIQMNARVVGNDDVMADPVVITVTRHP